MSFPSSFTLLWIIDTIFYCTVDNGFFSYLNIYSNIEYYLNFYLFYSLNSVSGAFLMDFQVNVIQVRWVYLIITISQEPNGQNRWNYRQVWSVYLHCFNFHLVFEILYGKDINGWGDVDSVSYLFGRREDGGECGLFSIILVNTCDCFISSV